MQTLDDPFVSWAVALGIGLLIGIERERRKGKGQGAARQVFEPSSSLLPTRSGSAFPPRDFGTFMRGAIAAAGVEAPIRGIPRHRHSPAGSGCTLRIWTRSAQVPAATREPRDYAGLTMALVNGPPCDHWHAITGCPAITGSI